MNQIPTAIRINAMMTTRITHPEIVIVLLLWLISYLTPAWPAPRAASAVLKICIFATGLAGIVAEFVLSTLATYIIGNAVLQWTDNMRLLETFAAQGLLAQEEAALLGDAYRAYRAEGHKCALQEQDAVVPDDRFADLRDRVTALWNRLMEV